MNPQERRQHFRKIATEYVSKINSETFCIKCGKQPIEWHHDDHPQNPNSRVSSLRTQGASIARIKREIERCEPLCRSCHMINDGRIKILHEKAPQQKGMIYVPPKPCIRCSKMTKPTRRGMCNNCYIKLMGIR